MFVVPVLKRLKNWNHEHTRKHTNGPNISNIQITRSRTNKSDKKKGCSKRAALILLSRCFARLSLSHLLIDQLHPLASFYQLLLSARLVVDDLFQMLEGIGLVPLNS